MQFARLAAVAFLLPLQKKPKQGQGGRTDSPLTNPFPAPCCAGYERRFSAKKPSVLHADGLNKVSQMHLPPPDLPRFGGGERPPFPCKPPAPLTITMGQRLIFRPIIVLTALRCPKKSSHYSFARFFRPLRILRLASSATGGARLRIPIPRDPLGNSLLSPIGGASLCKA